MEEATYWQSDSCLKDQKNNPGASRFRLDRKPRKVPFHFTSAFRICKHLFLSDFEKNWSCSHHVACHSALSYFPLFSNFGTHWPTSTSDREVGVCKIEGSHVVLKNRTEAENLLRALGERKGWSVNSDKDQRPWDMYVMIGWTGQGGKRSKANKNLPNQCL